MALRERPNLIPSKFLLKEAAFETTNIPIFKRRVESPQYPVIAEIRPDISTDCARARVNQRQRAVLDVVDRNSVEYDPAIQLDMAMILSFSPRSPPCQV